MSTGESINDFVARHPKLRDTDTAHGLLMISKRTGMIYVPFEQPDFNGENDRGWNCVVLRNPDKAAQYPFYSRKKYHVYINAFEIEIDDALDLDVP